jgi:hypothetical protein
MGSNLDAVRAAVEQAKIIAAEFHTGTANFYEDGNPVPVLTCPIRMRKPKPSAFDAGNQTEWGTKRGVVGKVPLNVDTEVIQKGWICQVSTPDGDPTINNINFVVQSSLVSQFAAEREVTFITEVTDTPRVVTP